MEGALGLVEPMFRLTVTFYILAAGMSALYVRIYALPAPHLYTPTMGYVIDVEDEP